MKYDSRKNLSENKKYLLHEEPNQQDNVGFTNSYNVFGKPIAFKGQIINTVGQQITGTWPPVTIGDRRLAMNIIGGNDDLLNKEIERSKNSKNIDSDYKFLMKDALSVVKGLGVNMSAPYMIFSDGSYYYLRLDFLSGNWGKDIIKGKVVDNSRYYPWSTNVTKSIGTISNTKMAGGVYEKNGYGGEELKLIYSHVQTKNEPTKKPEIVVKAADVATNVSIENGEFVITAKKTKDGSEKDTIKDKSNENIKKEIKNNIFFNIDDGGIVNDVFIEV